MAKSDMKKSSLFSHPMVLDSVCVVETGTTCGALPRGGDGSAPCLLPRFHKGLHEGVAGVFRKIEAGSSPRSPWRTRRRRYAQWLEG